MISPQIGVLIKQSFTQLQQLICVGCSESCEMYDNAYSREIDEESIRKCSGKLHEFLKDFPLSEIRTLYFSCTYPSRREENKKRIEEFVLNIQVEFLSMYTAKNPPEHFTSVRSFFDSKGWL